MEFLTRNNRHVGGEIGADELISAKGKRVLVIGGGDTGSDCVGTSNRHGALSVHQFEIMPKPREWEEASNPVWPNWPQILRTSSSHDEGCERRWSILTKQFSAGPDGRVNKAHFVEVEWKSTTPGKPPVPVEKAGSEFTLDVDLVLLAMGFVHVEHSKLLNDFGVQYDERGNIKTNGNYKTTVEGLFAAGDSHSGASLVVRAIDHGRRSAEAVNEYLS
jgi:glutamate synthase (NADPH/NADH) small chain